MYEDIVDLGRTCWPLNLLNITMLAAMCALVVNVAKYQI